MTEAPQCSRMTVTGQDTENKRTIYTYIDEVLVILLFVVLFLYMSIVLIHFFFSVLVLFILVHPDKLNENEKCFLGSYT